MSKRAVRFIALPVGQGDAFYLETAFGRVLVDGGRSIQGFAELFCRHTRTIGVDVAVCTHNDADHANGIIGFLAAGLPCREVWLPARWLSILPHLLDGEGDVLVALADSALQAVQSVRRLRADSLVGEGDRSLFELYGEMLARRFEGSAPDEPAGDSMIVVSEGGRGWPETLEEFLEALAWEPLWSPLRSDLPLWWLPKWWDIWDRLGWDRQASSLFLDALRAADRIVRIARTAYHAGIRVRWFEFSLRRPGGGEPWLQPLNAREVMSQRRIGKTQLFDYLALTVANRESLVFWAEVQEGGPGVVFTADSDLDGVALPKTLAGAIITAPHHGSEANARAYEVIQKHLGPCGSATWVRSDGRFRSRPGKSYLSAPGRRLCTLCRNSLVPHKQPVKLTVRGRQWIPNRLTKPCSCV